jgi:alkylation response protein AidB-like acyl-CoA dehydrogenase
MAEKFISERNLRFLLYELFNVESLLNYPRYADQSRDVFEMIMETAMRMGKTIFKPILTEMDRVTPEYVNGTVRVHPKVRDILRECGEGGWISATANYEHGGQQLPMMVGMMIPTAIFGAANYSASVYQGLTAGAAALIANFCPPETQELYLPGMYSGLWQGTMALTEPQAGSSLSDIVTAAEPAEGGYYKIRGQKIFISAGDHDGVDNVIHMILAKIQGSPAGVKGISLFIVPKKRIDAGGELVGNDVNCAGIYHKLGYKGCPITQLSFGENDDCRGWLVGEANKGLSYMFQMMNGARIDVGLGAASIASAAYYASLEYARERLQGRKLSSKDPLSPQVPIIEHPDVRRMLLFQRAVVEGSLSLLMQCSYLEDLTHCTAGEEMENAHLLLELLTPVAKSYPAEMGILSCSAGIQILGGYGYCDEFPLEQYYRDVRIHPIHEGSTGIQGMDLLGRKMMMQKGKAAVLYKQEVQKTIGQAKEDSELASCAGELEEALEKLEQVTAYLAGRGNAELFLADATLYLEFFGIITIAWQWLKQALVARRSLAAGGLFPGDINFYEGKLSTFRYFFVYELPKTAGLAASLTKGSSLTVDMINDYFAE